jgi:phosphate transport system permease protein
MTDITDAPAPDSQGSQDAKAFRSVRRDRTTSRRVHIGDWVANWSITVGGLLVIVAVIGIAVFLVSVAAPLSRDGNVLGHATYQLQPPKEVAWLSADEFGTMAARVTADGALSLFHLPSGALVTSDQFDFQGERATAVASVIN